ncbi:cysteine desulfurase family protein [Bradyrhizobium liaoningense]|uniref:cysteine desulfurase family protein n=1 Tax=Bradyrhizobium liaoningense TaxID=43992 RepID=UPI0006876082|nr:cysteine desulfurase family protein [Bradyrhizobium liaoningense]
MADSIFLDNHSTTPTDPRVREAMLPFLDAAEVGNPHSEHVAGRRAAEAVEAARAEAAALIGARAEEIIFTSGATEANNLALQGVMRSKDRRGNHILTCTSEHKCVLETAAYLSRSGCRVDVLPIEPSGLVDVAKLADAITDDTALVSIMAANNEIGVIQPILEIAAFCHAKGVVFHTDAAQAVGKIPIDVRGLGIDLMSLSGHKLYAPIGVGALFISEDTPVLPEPLMWGGGQERGFRSGTLAPHLCVALGAASAIARNECQSDAEHTKALRSRFLAVLRQEFPHVRVNCEESPRLPGNLSLVFDEVEADRLVGAVQPFVAVSTNAACTAGVLQPSHVLYAIGLSNQAAASTLRIGFGRLNTMAEVERAAARLGAAARQIREQELSDIVAA